MKAWRPACAPEGNAVTAISRGRTVRLSISRDGLLQRPPGWLNEWTATAEAEGCLASGYGTGLATMVLESVAIDPAAAYRLLHAGNVQKGYIDLGGETRLQVVTPVLKAGAAPDAPILATTSVTGNDRQLNVSAVTTDNLTGVETAWYGFQAKADGSGLRIAVISTERRIQGQLEPAAAPLVNYFQFAASAAHYRLFYKTDPEDNGITQVILAAPTRTELERRTRSLLADTSLCQKSDAEMCMVIPRRAAVNPFLMVTVNGAEQRLPVGSTVRRAVGKPEETLARLQVLKPHHGKLVPVEFDRNRLEILDLLLLGGESLSWQ